MSGPPTGPVQASGLDATGLAGEPGTSVEYRVQAERTVRTLADTLARLHSTELRAVSDGPGRPALPVMDVAAVLGRAHAAVAAGRITPDGLSAPYRHLGPERLVEVLADGAPGAEQRCGKAVLTHGAPTLDHLRCEHGIPIGFVEWGDAAVADPYRDLAVAARSIAGVFGPVLIPVFFDQYGAERPDPILLDWYSLAAELVG